MVKIRRIENSYDYKMVEPNYNNFTQGKEDLLVYFFFTTMEASLVVGCYLFYRSR
jgi:hypothetical protein